MSNNNDSTIIGLASSMVSTLPTLDVTTAQDSCIALFAIKGNTDIVESEGNKIKNDAKDSITQEDPQHITTLPSEIIFMIFGHLATPNAGDATTFGLTCRRFYTFLKKQHPQPIHLLQTITVPQHGMRLGHLLKAWVGPEYRIHITTQKGCAICAACFVKHSVYGSEQSIASRRVSERHFCWARIDLHDQRAVKGSTALPTARRLLLPPNNMGENWWNDVFELMEKELAEGTSSLMWWLDLVPLNVRRRYRERLEDIGRKVFLNSPMQLEIIADTLL